MDNHPLHAGRAEPDIPSPPWAPQPKADNPAPQPPKARSRPALNQEATMIAAYSFNRSFGMMMGLLLGLSLGGLVLGLVCALGVLVARGLGLL